MTGKLQFKPVFVQNANTRNFGVMMDRLSLDEGEGRLAVAHGRAGWGKTRTTLYQHGLIDSVYLRMQAIWSTSELDFLQKLLKELGHKTPPGRKGACFTHIVDILTTTPIPIFLDEVDRVPARFVDLIRDLTDISTAPVILIGEEGLPGQLRANTRVWSRVAAQTEFKPMGIADVILYAQKVAGLTLHQKVGEILHKASDGRNGGGNFRVVKRTVLTLLQMLNSEGADGSAVTVEMANTAVRAGLGGGR